MIAPDGEVFDLLEHHRASLLGRFASRRLSKLNPAIALMCGRDNYVRHSRAGNNRGSF